MAHLERVPSDVPSLSDCLCIDSARTSGPKSNTDVNCVYLDAHITLAFVMGKRKTTSTKKSQQRFGSHLSLQQSPPKGTSQNAMQWAKQACSAICSVHSYEASCATRFGMVQSSIWCRSGTSRLPHFLCIHRFALLILCQLLLALHIRVVMLLHVPQKLRPALLQVELRWPALRANICRGVVRLRATQRHVPHPPSESLAAQPLQHVL
mmetsp:Transcript_76659/g.194526  ORF Transcript_76659/g.194526 Transcript_76659/m.194526 type:complete len:208 (+) Transcript_76659:103-726(+)